MRKTLLAAAALAAAPLFAQGTGWSVGAFAVIGDQTGNDTVLANTSDANRNPNGFVRLKMDAKVIPGILVNYKTDMGTWGFSFRGGKADAATNAYQANGYMFPNFGNPWNDQWRFSYIWGRQESKTHAVDFTFARELAKTDKSNFEWVIGLREWKFENTLWANGCLDAAGIPCNTQSPTANPYTGNQTVYRERSDSKGIGLTFALRGHYKFTDRVSAASWIRYGMLRGTTDLEVQDEAHYGTVVGARCDNTTRSYCSDLSTDAKRTFMQTEFGARIDFDIWKGLGAFVGYVFANTNDAVTSLDYTISGGYGFGPALRTRTVGHNGFLLGANWKF